MAVITRLPAQAIIDGFRGVLDFYEDKGLHVVRSWPRNKNAGYTPGARINQPTFARVNRLKRYVSQSLKVAYDRYTQGGSNTWADQFIVTYNGKNRPNDRALPPSPRS